MTLYFEIAPLDRPPSEAGMFIVCWPLENGDGRYLQNAHPDKCILDSEAGDVLVHRQRGEQYRMVAVQQFGDWKGPWFRSVREVLEAP